MVELKARPPVRRPQQSLQGAGEVDEHVAHQKEPEERRTEERRRHIQKKKKTSETERRIPTTTGLHSNEHRVRVELQCAYMERMGATESREAMMMPISQMLAVSRRAQVGSPLALPCPNTCSNIRRMN